MLCFCLFVLGASVNSLSCRFDDGVGRRAAFARWDVLPERSDYCAAPELWRRVSKQFLCEADRLWRDSRISGQFLDDTRVEDASMPKRFLVGVDLIIKDQRSINRQRC